MVKMNAKEEGAFYADMVKKFRSEYGSKNLTKFCRDQKVSYNKMLHCLRDYAYQKPTETAREDDEPECSLHPLVVDPPLNSSPSLEKESATKPLANLGDVEIALGNRITFKIKSCSPSSLVALMKEMEACLC